MGILKHLLFWPATGPLFLTRFALEKVEDTVREELTDDRRIREELTELQLELELGEIDEDEYERREAELMRRLRDVREWRRRFGMGVRGGPVRVAGEGAASGATVEADVDAGSDTSSDAGGEEDDEEEWSRDSRDGSSGGSTPGSSSS